MKKILLRFWNFRVGGIFKAIFLICDVFYLTFYEKISSAFWSFNVGKCGTKLVVQKGTSIRNPKNIIFKNNISIGRKCQISCEFEDSFLYIDNNTHINKECMIDFSGGLTIGCNVTISEGVMIQTHSHGLKPRSTPVKKPLIIEDNVWLGARAIILPSVNYIGKNSVIGSGSIVTKNVEENCIVAGCPAKLVKMNL